MLHEKSLLFQQRFEEGYDLPDEEYKECLHENHPECRSECCVNSNNGSERIPLCIVDAFSDLLVVSSLPIVTSELLV